MNKQIFPDSFVWGAASSACQVEGASSLEERGPSVWDTFCQKEGTIKNGDAALVGCDHCRLLDTDVRLMSEIGLEAYRFSISWPRIMPEGRGNVNPKGIAFYDELIDSLLAVGIEPWVTLFHWDFPEVLFQQGGWLNRDSASWFADYAAKVVWHFSDRVSNWVTINEPQCFLQLGHKDGIHAPGIKLPTPELITAAHHTLLAHGMAAKTIRENATLDPILGIAPVGLVKVPETESKLDIEAARTATMSLSAESLWNNTWFCDPVFLGNYPEDGLEAYEVSLSQQWVNDLEVIQQPLDLVGLNIYSASTVRATQDGQFVDVPFPAGSPRTAFGWPIAPEALNWGPKFYYERYNVPVVISENGMSNTDWVASDGAVHDPQRIDFLEKYLSALRRAMDNGVSILGFFHWSLMDNFEWAEGYDQRFGLIHVDFETQQRTLKDSAYWYRDVIRSRGGTLARQAPEVISESVKVG